MSITDELREFAKRWPCTDYIHKDMLTIADRIDAEHEAMLVDARKTVYQGYIELPKDADGEYIHVGERVQLIGNDPSTVSHMSLADDGWRVYVKYDGGIGTGSGEPKRIRHHHAPTVEDVLREFLGECEHASMLGYTDMPQDIFDTYATKLRLAGDAE